MRMQQRRKAGAITETALAGEFLFDMSTPALWIGDGATNYRVGLFSDIPVVGTIAAQDASAVAITGGSITGITDLAIADGGTGASTAADARTNLGLVAIAASGSASDLSTGTVPDARFPATLPAASGVNLTALNATNLASGTVADARLSANVALENAANVFTTLQMVDGTANVVQLTVQGHSTQTANLQEWEDSAGFAHVFITSDWGYGFQYSVSTPSWKFFAGAGGQCLFRNVTAGTDPLCLGSQGFLGVQTTAPAYPFHLRYGVGTLDAPMHEVDTVTDGVVPTYAVFATGGGGANLSNGDLCGAYTFWARSGGNTLREGDLRGIYTGDGSTRYLDIGVFTSKNAAPTETARFTGLGSTVIGAQAALATTATDGFLYIPTCAGTPTGVPTAHTGKVPMVYDSTNNILYVYSNGAWRAH